jgi:hypothetical protein
MPAETSPVLPNQARAPHSPSVTRDRAPVFVLGCGRSGTKFLYHTLLSAGGFAVYYAESNAFNLLGSRFGNLRYRRNRQKMLDTWFISKLFQRTGLIPEEIEPRVLNECQSAADFLRIVMETIAHKQGVHRWAECTPLHLLYLPLIKSLIPEALIVHIIRDGRDVAVSLDKIGWIRPYPWDRNRSVITAGIFWRWIVSKGLAYGRSMGHDYTEVHYEDLVAQPQQTLARLGEFLQHDLDYDRIQKASLGSLQSPNSSFKDDRTTTDFSPVGRWKTVLTEPEVKDLETAISDLLGNLNYQLETPREQLTKTSAVRLMSLLYPTVFDVKLWLKNHTPLARTADIGRMGLIQSTEAD